MNRTFNALIACAGIIASSAAAEANIADGVNRIRSRGCDGRPGTSIPLEPSRGLDKVAREWSKGGRLDAAISRTDYRIINSSSMRVEGAASTRAILDVLASQYCARIVDPSFTEIGVFEHGRDVWIVVATPFSAPGVKDARTVSNRVLVLVNQARAEPRKCGRARHEAAPPLELSPRLERAAHMHASDMAENEFFEHRGSDGSEPEDRVSTVGYRWRTVGENIAAGAPDADSVVSGWLESPGHCANIMSPKYTQMGVAYVVEQRSKDGIYWSQVFARPE